MLVFESAQGLAPLAMCLENKNDPKDFYRVHSAFLISVTRKHV